MIGMDIDHTFERGISRGDAQAFRPVTQTPVRALE